MKRIIALILSLALLLSGCAPAQTQPTQAEETQHVNATTDPTAYQQDEIVWQEVVPEYSALDNSELLCYVEDLVYRETVGSLNSEEYFVENVSAVYISKEYLEEVAFNSQSNIYFGYTLAELDELFQGSRYIFTLGDDGQTTVRELQEIEDTSTETMLKNVAIGTGVILVCVTVSAITAGAGAPAVSLIFAASAKTGTIMALSSAGFGGFTAGVVRGIETGDFGEAMEAAALASSEGFKWGAISGVISGGISETVKYTQAMQALKGTQLNGLTTQQAAAIQMESGYPVDVIKQFSNMEQYNICKTAGLSPQMVNGNTALIRNIDLNFVDDMGRTNLQRMQQGLAALDPTGVPYELHHIGQHADSTLAILTKAEHMQGGNNKIWHILGEATEVHGAGNTWDTQRQQFWKAVAKMIANGGA